GPLLPESPYDDAFAEPRQRLAHLRLRLLQEKAALAKAAGDWDEALASYRTVLDEDPTQEAILADLLRVCRLLNARDEAARYFQAYSKQISRELGLDPTPELVRLYQWFRAAAREEGPAKTPRAKATPPGGLTGSTASPAGTAQPGIARPVMDPYALPL